MLADIAGRNTMTMDHQVANSPHLTVVMPECSRERGNGGMFKIVEVPGGR